MSALLRIHLKTSFFPSSYFCCWRARPSRARSVLSAGAGQRQEVGACGRMGSSRGWRRRPCVSCRSVWARPRIASPATPHLLRPVTSQGRHQANPQRKRLPKASAGVSSGVKTPPTPSVVAQVPALPVQLPANAHPGRQL